MSPRRHGLAERLRSFRGDLAEDPRAPRSGLKRQAWFVTQWLLLAWWLLRDLLSTAPRQAALAISTAPFEVRAGVRGLRHRPGLTATVVLTLAAGTGSSIAAYGLLYEMLLRPLPYPEPERLVAVWPELWASRQHYDLLRDGMTSLPEVAAFSPSGVTLSGDGDPAMIFGPEVTPEFFDLLGLRTQLGRGISDGDELPGAESVIVLAHAFWVSRFGADPGIVGRALEIDGEPTRVIGILEPGADLMQSDAEIVRPLRIDPAAPEYGTARYLRLYGRLGEGATPERALQEVKALAGAWQDVGLSERLIAAATMPSLLASRVGEQRPLLLLLAGAVGLVVAIACVNVAGLLLGRNLERRHELSVRRALGASTAQLFAHVLSEAAVLAIGGTLAGLAAAAWLLAALRPVLAEHVGMTRLSGSVWHPEVVAFSVGMMVLVTLLAGGLPGLGVLRHAPANAISHGGRATQSRHATRSSDVLVIAQVAIAAVLLVAASLTLRSLMQMARVDIAYEPANRFTFWLSPEPAVAADGAALEAYYMRATETLRAVPGILDARAIHVAPARGGGWVGGIRAEGVEYPNPDDMPTSFFRIVETGYLEAIGARLRRGRLLEPQDVRGSTGVAVINETLARSLWGDADPIGRRLRSTMVDDYMTVVGVIADMRHMDPRSDPVPTFYAPLSQKADTMVGFGFRTLAIVVRTDLEEAAAFEAARRAIWSVDPDVPVIDPEFLERTLSESLVEPRLVSGTLLGFAAAALGLAALGLYGSIARSVRRRTHEMGIRQAIGARPADLMRQSLGRNVVLVALGLSLGGGIYALSRPLLRGFLFGVGDTDPLSLAWATLALMVVAALASLGPARRAARISPTEALRAE